MVILKTRFAFRRTIQIASRSSGCTKNCSIGKALNCLIDCKLLGKLAILACVNKSLGLSPMDCSKLEPQAGQSSRSTICQREFKQNHFRKRMVLRMISTKSFANINLDYERTLSMCIDSCGVCKQDYRFGSACRLVCVCKARINFKRKNFTNFATKFNLISCQVISHKLWLIIIGYDLVFFGFASRF